ncbi:helix-turn-helix transcriptional regulator [soil metagenome]
MQIVGRHNELARLREAVDSTLDGRGRLILIGGEAGIGKTALVEQFRDEIDGSDILVLDAAVYEAPIAPPFGVWIELFDDLPERDGLPGLPRELRSAASDPPAESRISLFHDVLTFLQELSHRMPAVLILEDLHWSDRASLDLLRYVSRQLAGERLLVVGTYRHEALPETPLYQSLPHLVREGPAERIQLHRLVTGDVRRLVAGRYGLDEDETARLADYIQGLADGNPFFIDELLRTLEDDGALWSESGAWRLDQPGDIAVPMLVQQLIDSRLEGTDERTSEALGAAAVLGTDVPLEDWEDLLDDAGDLETAIEHALRVHVMRDVPGAAGHMRFTHSIVRRAVYARLLPTTRQRLHRAAAELLATRPGAAPGMVAHHFEQARDPRQAVDWFMQAGDHATMLHAYEIAVEHFTRVLEFAGESRLDLAIRALRSRSKAFNLIGDFERARGDLETALGRSRTAADRETTWGLLLDLGFLWTERDYSEANSYLQQALDLARDLGSAAMIGASLNRVGNLESNDDRPREAIELHREALAIFEGLDDDAGVAETLDFLAVANYLHGDLVQCAEQYREVIRRCRELGDLHGQASALPTLMCAGGSYDSDTLYVAPGALTAWLDYGHQGIEAASKAGWRAGLAYARIHMGYVLGAHGQYGPALNMLDEGIAVAERIGHREWIVAGHFNLGVVLNDLLQPERASEHLEHAYTAAHEIHSRFWMRTTTVALVDFSLPTGDLLRAERLLDGVLSADSPMDTMAKRQCWMRRARLELARNNPEPALDILDGLIANTPGDVQEPRVPHLDRLRGQALSQLERLDEARASFDLALRRAEELELLPLCWRIFCDLAGLHRRMGDREAALDARLRGRDLLNRLAGSIEDDDLRAAYLGRMPADLASGGGDDSSGDPFGLSKREREVLQVASEGLTDAEIGERLGISPRTVGRHLQSLYTKLGVNSRTAAVSRAFEHGLIESR